VNAPSYDPRYLAGLRLYHLGRHWDSHEAWAEGAPYPPLPGHRPGARDHDGPPDGTPPAGRPVGEGRVGASGPPGKKSMV